MAGALTPAAPARQNAGMPPAIDLTPLRRAVAVLAEALQFWHLQPEGSALKPHLRSAVIQSFEFSYELSLRLLRRVLMERASSADTVVDLSFNDVLRLGADQGLLPDALAWRQWRELRNAISHAYNEAKAQAVAEQVGRFNADAVALLVRLEAALEP